MAAPDAGKRGMALLMVLAVMAVLIPTGLELNRRVRLGLRTAAALRDRTQLDQMAVSGIHLAMALLAHDRSLSETDSLREDWADPEQIRELLTAIPFGAGRLALEISDERGRLQANALVVSPGGFEANDPQLFLWDRFLTRLIAEEESFEGIEATPIVQALKDWVDTGDDDAVTGLQGAESSYYQGLDPPYDARNGPLAFIGDLLRVRGITPDLFFGRGEAPGLRDTVTVHGRSRIAGGQAVFDGRININTAPRSILLALLPPEHEAFVEALYEYRQARDGDRYIHDLSGRDWYRNVIGFSDLKAARRQRFEALITTSSDLYRLHSTAELDGRHRTVTAVVRRERNPETGRWLCRVLDWSSAARKEGSAGENGPPSSGN